MPSRPSTATSPQAAGQSPSQPQSQSPGLRVSQRPPTACRECSLRKVRCDKQTPCGRCLRLSRRCTREVVRISKSLSLHRDELRFLRGLRARLTAAGSSGQQEGIDWDMRQAAVADIDGRVRLLEHGKAEDEDEDVMAMSPVTPSPDAEQPVGEQPQQQQQNQQHHHRQQRLQQQQAAFASTETRVETNGTSTITAASSKTARTTRSPRTASAAQMDNSNQASVVTAFEFLAWGRHIQGCFPHRRCSCYQHRRYSELVSINCDAAWVGRLAMTVSVPVDADVLLPVAVASKVVQFHVDHLHWHHNAFHAPTFLARCRQFWSTGTTDHPLWLALYLAVCSVSLWALLNADRHREAMGLGDLGELGGLSDSGGGDRSSIFGLDAALVERQFQAMVAVLYGENFLEHLSLYSVQAILISTRIAHNLDRSELNATLVGAAVRIAHCLGLHKISDPPTLDDDGNEVVVSWHERVEIETGKRVWTQLLIQDHFQIPFTDSYIINPEQYTTPLPENCSDYDMVPRGPDVPTNSSYVRMLARTASLMPPLLDGLGPMSARKTPAEVYGHILACDRAMRANVANIPEFLLREDAATTTSTSTPPTLPWLGLARRTLAISAAEKIIMIHRPVLFESFQSTAFRPTRAICVSAAVTILREHEQAIVAGVVPIWTHSAFCVTGAVVLGLELFHRTDHTDDVAHTYRQMLARAADRLRSRRGDAIARRGALLIDTLLAAEEDLVLRLMRTARPSAATAAAAAEDHQRSIINDMIGSHEIMARFLARAPPKPSAAVGTTVGSVGLSPPITVSSLTNRLGTTGVSATATAGSTATDDSSDAIAAVLPSMDFDAAQDFDLWFNEVFAPVYDPML